jgi:hypothetical protein
LRRALSRGYLLPLVNPYDAPSRKEGRARFFLTPKSSVRAFATTLGIALVAAASPSAARAESLSTDESAKLARGETVARPVTLDGDDRRYVGGITYAVVRASVSELQELFEDVSAYKNVLPRTKRAALVGHEGLDQLVELHQGNAVIDATYTLRVRHEAWRRDVRFWLDQKRPHDIRDAWGYFHVDPMADDEGGARSLVTYAVLVDLGPGIVRELFEERLRTVLLSTPSILSRFLVSRRRTPRHG